MEAAGAGEKREIGEADVSGSDRKENPFLWRKQRVINIVVVYTWQIPFYENDASKIAWKHFSEGL